MFKIKISNYRNISRENPIELEIEKGTIFIVGRNNIGKSNILKFFYEFRSLFQHILVNFVSRHTNHELVNTIGTIQLQTIKDHYSLLDTFNQSNSGDISFTISKDNCRFTIEIIRKRSALNNSTEISYQITALEREGYHLRDFSAFSEELGILSNTIYLGAFRNLLNNGGNNYYDLSIGNQFITVFDHWKTGNEKDKNRKIKNLIKELKNIFQLNELDIEADPERTKLKVMLNDKIHNSDEIGGGIQQFIISLATIVIKEPELILIDEPELNLHPKMQEDFLRVLALKVKFGILASSHSIALARSSADKIYSLTESEKGNPVLKKYGEPHRLSQLLGELSYSQYCELGADNILLVEGFTDMACFREILRKYDIEKHFIVMMLGGSAFFRMNEDEILKELDEIKRFGAKSINAIIDSEKKSATDTLSEQRKNFVSACQKLSIAVHVTEKRATENYISDLAVKKIRPGVNALSEYEELKQWSKNENWKMINHMTKEEFDKTDIGNFIKTKLLKSEHAPILN